MPPSYERWGVLPLWCMGMKYTPFVFIIPACLLAIYLIWKLLKKTILWIFILILVALAFLLFHLGTGIPFPTF